MSLEQTIADAATEVGLARDEILGLVGVADAQITRVGDRYDAILASQSVTLYVEALTGNDTNEGTEAAPLQTLEAAIALVPRGGRGVIWLMGDYHVDTNVLIDGKHLFIGGHNGVRYSLTFERYTVGSAPEVRVLYGFRFGEGGSLQLNDLGIVVPAVDTFHIYALANTGMFGVSSSHSWQPLSVVLARCDIVLPASPFCYLFADSNIVSFFAYALSYTGAITSAHGRLFQGAQNTGGTSVTSLPWLTSNLTTV